MQIRLRLALAAVAVLAGCSTPGPDAVPMRAQTLFNDDAFRGWEIVSTPAVPLASVVTRGSDGVIAVSGKPVGYIATTARYADYALHVEWRWSGKPGNSGVLLHIASGPKDGPWPDSLQVQTKFGVAGDLLPMAGARFAEPLTSAPGVPPPIRAHQAADSERPAGEWNSADITSRAGTVEVHINGVLQNRVTGVVPQAGRIGFQLEGTPFELRNVVLVTFD